MNKRLFLKVLLSILSMYPFTGSYAMDLFLFLNDGRIIAMNFEEDFSVEFQDSEISIGNQTFDITGVSKYTIGKMEADGIEEVMDYNNELVFTENNEIKIPATGDNGIILLYDIQGKRLPVKVNDLGNEKVVSLKNYQPGIYVLVYNNNSLKFRLK